MLRREAATWLARLQGGRDPDVERKFRQWHDADPRNSEAFARVRRSYDQAGLLRHSSAIAARRAERVSPGPRWQPRPALAALAVLVVLAPLVTLLVRGDGAPLGGNYAVMLMTGVGEIRQVKLADGSKVTLDTATKVDVEIDHSRRRAHLGYGRVRFEVAQADTPFVVETGSTTISTRQGVIDVEQGPQQDHIQVLAGAADVRGPIQRHPSHLALAAGQSAIVGSRGAERTAVASPASDWARGMLQFEATPLADAVALANRYSERHIIIAGDVDALRVTGAFRAGDTARFANALAAAFGLSLQQREDGNMILSRSGSRPLQNKKGG